MDFQLFRIASIVVLRPEATTDAGQVKRFNEGFRQYLSTGEPLGVMIVVPTYSGVPDPGARDAMTAETTPLFKQFRWGAVVVEGGGIGAEMKRLFARALMLLTGSRFMVCGNIDDAITQAPAELIHNRVAFLAELQRKIAEHGR